MSIICKICGATVSDDRPIAHIVIRLLKNLSMSHKNIK